MINILRSMEILSCNSENLEFNIYFLFFAGIPELDVPGLDPLVIPELVISRGEDAARFRAVGHNVKVYGAGQFKITNLR